MVSFDSDKEGNDPIHDRPSRRESRFFNDFIILHKSNMEPAEAGSDTTHQSSTYNTPFEYTHQSRTCNVVQKGSKTMNKTYIVHVKSYLNPDRGAFVQVCVRSYHACA